VSGAPPAPARMGNGLTQPAELFHRVPEGMRVAHRARRRGSPTADSVEHDVVVLDRPC
jgi:hypothetical protein